MSTLIQKETLTDKTSNDTREAVETALSYADGRLGFEQLYSCVKDAGRRQEVAETLDELSEEGMVAKYLAHGNEDQAIEYELE